VLLSETTPIPSQRQAIVRIGRLLADSKMTPPVAVGHRIVHGGPKLRCHCLIDDKILRRGIGENDEEVRAAICLVLSWIGVSLDETRNASANNPVNDSASRCCVRVLPTQENEQIARHTWALLPKSLS
jgi:acetate kinase